MRVAIALTLVALGGCFSVFADSGRGWKPDQGAPTCRPSTALVADVVVLAVGIVGAIAGAESCGAGDGDCPGIRATPGLVVSMGGATGAIIGGVKMTTCQRTRRRWDLLRATVSDEIARATGTRVMELGDTLVLVAPSPAICHDARWFEPVRRHRAVMIGKGLVRASCRVGDVELASGRIDL